MISILFYSYQIQSVAQRDDDVLHARVFDDHAVELHERLRVAVVVRDGLHYFPRPEDVVGDEHRAAVHQPPSAVVAHQHPVIGGVFALVAVDEHHVELA